VIAISWFLTATAVANRNDHTPITIDRMIAIAQSGVYNPDIGFPYSSGGGSWNRQCRWDPSQCSGGTLELTAPVTSLRFGRSLSLVPFGLTGMT
jgi:hypothetical protein